MAEKSTRAANNQKEFVCSTPQSESPLRLHRFNEIFCCGLRNMGEHASIATTRPVGPVRREARIVYQP